MWSVQKINFSTLYTSIPHNLLKSTISNLVHNVFRKRDGSVRHTQSKLQDQMGISLMVYGRNLNIRTRKLRTLRLKFSVMHHLNKNLILLEYLTRLLIYELHWIINLGKKSLKIYYQNTDNGMMEFQALKLKFDAYLS